MAGRDTYRFLLRMPAELREKLTAATARSGRSLNAEIVHRLAESLDPHPPERRARPLRAERRGEKKMRRTWIAVSAIALVVLAPVGIAALAGGDRPGAVAPAPALSPGAERLAEFKQLGVFANNVSESEEFPAAADAEAYANRAYPQDAIAFQQTLASIGAAKRLKSRGASSPSKWVDVGPDTMQVAQLGTQHWGRPTQWSGRVSAMAVDTRHCSASACKLYIGAAGGGVWRTNNALAQRPNWKELSTGHGLPGDRLDPDRPERRDRQHDLRRHRRAERLERQRGRRRSLPLDRRRQPLDARPGQSRRGGEPRHRRHRGGPVESGPHPDRHRRRAARALVHLGRALHAAGRAAARAVGVA